MIILGIDPGSARIGFGAIKKEKGGVIHLKNGIFDISNVIEKNDRLIILEAKINDLIDSLKPARVGLEKIFFTKNKKTAIEVAEAKGVIFATIARKKVPVVEITPTQTKIAVTGDGRASKEAVAKMVNRLLGLSEKTPDDTTDALAIAIAVANC